MPTTPHPLRRAREEAEISRTALALCTGTTTPSSIAHAEQGITVKLGAGVLAAGEQLGLNPDELQAAHAAWRAAHRVTA